MTDPRQQLILERLHALRSSQERIERELGEGAEQDDESRSEPSDEPGNSASG